MLDVGEQAGIEARQLQRIVLANAALGDVAVLDLASGTVLLVAVRAKRRLQ